MSSDDETTLLANNTEERSVTLEGAVESKRVYITLTDDDVHVDVSGTSEFTMSYHDVLGWAHGEQIWILHYAIRNGKKRRLEFYPRLPLTPKQCSETIRSFVDDIMERNS
jgi:hypothetical protein